MQSLPVDILRKISDYLTPYEVSVLARTNKENQKQLKSLAFRSLLRACISRFEIDARTLAPSQLCRNDVDRIIFNAQPRYRSVRLECPLSDVKRLCFALVEQGFKITPYSVYEDVEEDKDYNYDENFLDNCPFHYIPFQKGSMICFAEIEYDEEYFRRERWPLIRNVWHIPRFHRVRQIRHFI